MKKKIFSCCKSFFDFACSNKEKDCYCLLHCENCCIFCSNNMAQQQLDDENYRKNCLKRSSNITKDGIMNKNIFISNI